MQNKSKPQSTQDAFNRIWQFFIVEGHNQSRDTNGCAYRGKEKGTACAIGCMLPTTLAKRADKLFHTENNSAIEKVIDRIPEVGNWFEEVDWAFLKDAQTTHDKGDFNENKENLLTALAKEYGLTIPAATLGDLTKGRNRVLANIK